RSFERRPHRRPRREGNDKGGYRRQGQGNNPRFAGGNGNNHDGLPVDMEEDEALAEQRANQPRPEGTLKIRDLKLKSAEELLALAEEAGIENSGGMLKQDLVFAILKKMAEINGQIIGEGVL